MKAGAWDQKPLLPLVIAAGLAALALLACAQTTPTSGSTPSGATETLTAGAACPPPGSPALAQPANPADYPAAIQRYLSAGGDVVTLESMLADWNVLPDAAGQVLAADLTGDGTPDEVVIALRYVGDATAPSGDLLIFGCQAGSYTLLYQEGYDPYGVSIQLLQVVDANKDGRPDVAYTMGTCGAHTCFETLEILEWEETGFFSMMGGRLDMPYPTYVITPGRIEARSGLIGSVGADPQRGYSEVWEWKGGVFTVTQQIWEPPVYRYHALLDGDRALLNDDYDVVAAAAYKRVITDDTLREWGAVSGTVDPAEERAQLAAFAQWRLVLTDLRAGNPGNAQAQYNRLRADHPAGAVGHDVAALAEVFWTTYSTQDSITDGCAALVAAAKLDTSVHDFFNENYGYANPRWEAVDLCPFIE